MAYDIYIITTGQSLHCIECNAAIFNAPAFVLLLQVKMSDVKKSL